VQGPPQLGLGQPPGPGHLSQVRGDDLRKHGIAHPKPVRAEPTPVEKLEPKAHRRLHPQLLTELAGSRLLIRLANSRSAPDTEFVVPWEPGQMLSPPMDEKAPLPVAAHHHANTVQPAFPDGLPPGDHSQHSVLSIDTFHEFIHDAHGPRHH
jgi:hypothetical protein